MSGISKKLMGTTAAGGFTAIEDVFSTYLYTGTSSAQTITNGIDLAGEGGLVWIKPRDDTGNTQNNWNALYDTERGIWALLSSNETLASTVYYPQGLSAFNSDGFSVAFSGGYGHSVGGIGYASWTFRKAPRFFDVVTYTGANQSSIAHNLGVKPACIIFKRTDGTENWIVYHQNLTTPNANWWDNAMNLNTTIAGADVSGGTFLTQEPDENNIYIGSFFNPTNKQYVAYLFAHDPLGPSGDGSDGLIACGSYTGNGSTDGPEIDLGWEPQWVILKRTDSAEDWQWFDSMRGFPAGGACRYLEPNTSDAEATYFLAEPMPNGFKVKDGGVRANASGGTYIYIAIRRGPMRQPESGTEVFAVSNRDATPPLLQSGFPVDFGIYYSNVTTTRNNIASARLTQGRYLLTNSTQAEAASGSYQFDFNDGYLDASLPASTDAIAHMWRRAPGFFDVVAYDGGVASNAVPHNLGVTPEMYFIKCRSDGAANRAWAVYHKDLTDPANYYLKLNDNIAQSNLTNIFNGTTDASTFGVRDGFSIVNESGQTYIAYLFASSPGVSKVGSYTGNGTSQTISCGFTSGARFILIKRIDSTGAWYVWDTERGIVAGNDPHLSPNNTAAEITTDDSVDPDNSGFIVNQNAATNINVSSATYIFYAIA